MADRQIENSPSGRLLTAETDGFKLQWKDDGFDYPALWREIRQGRIVGRKLAANPLFREAWMVETRGRAFLVKKDWYTEKRPEKRLFFRLAGQKRYGRIITLVNKAVNNGCLCVQEAFLTAEKSSAAGDEAWLIADFVIGRSSARAELEADLPGFAAVISEIHSYGLACNDIQPNNFIRTESGRLVAVDLDMSSPLLICQVNDILKLKRRYGFSLPLKGRPGARLLCGLLEIRDRIMRFSRKIRGKPDKLKKRV